VASGGLLAITGTYGAGDTLSASLTGEGTRMFFYPKKAAFRAGYVDSDQSQLQNSSGAQEFPF
jgi:hypothetical protein